MTSADNPTARLRVLVGVDGSTASMQALRWARYLAESTGAVVEAVHAWQPPASYGYGWAGSAGQRTGTQPTTHEGSWRRR